MEDDDPGTDEPVTIFSRNYIAFGILLNAILSIVWVVMLAVQPVGSLWWWWAIIMLPFNVVYLVWHSVTLVRIDRQEKRMGGEKWPPW